MLGDEHPPRRGPHCGPVDRETVAHTSGAAGRACVFAGPRGHPHLRQHRSTRFRCRGDDPAVWVLWVLALMPTSTGSASTGNCILFPGGGPQLLRYNSRVGTGMIGTCQRLLRSNFGSGSCLRPGPGVEASAWTSPTEGAQASQNLEHTGRLAANPTRPLWPRSSSSLTNRDDGAAARAREGRGSAPHARVGCRAGGRRACG